MRCETVQLELHGYLRDELAPDIRSAVEEHLESCQTCSREAASMRGLGDQIARGLKEWVDAGACPPELAARIEVHIRERSSTGWWKGWRMPAGAVAAAAAFLLFLVARPDIGDQVATMPLLGTLAAQLNPPEFQVHLDAVNAREGLVRDPGRVVRVNERYTLHGITLTVHRVQFGRESTMVQYSLTGLDTDEETPTKLLEPRLTGTEGPVPLHSFAGDKRKSGIMVHAYFDAVPAKGALALEVDGLPMVVAEPVQWTLDRSGRAGAAGPGAAVSGWEPRAEGALLTIEWPAASASRMGGWGALSPLSEKRVVSELSRSESSGRVTQRVLVTGVTDPDSLTLRAEWVERRLTGPWKVTLRN